MVNQSFASHGRAATAVILLLVALASGKAEAAKVDGCDGERVAGVDSKSLHRNTTMPIPNSVMALPASKLAVSGS